MTEDILFSRISYRMTVVLNEGTQYYGVHRSDNSHYLLVLLLLHTYRSSDEGIVVLLFRPESVPDSHATA